MTNDNESQDMPEQYPGGLTDAERRGVKAEHVLDVPDHPAALKPHERRGIMMKHVLWTTLKWLAIGALVGGLLFAAVPALFAAAGASAAPWWAQLAGFFGIASGNSMATGILAWVGNSALSAGITGALLGGITAGVLGLGSALFSMDAKADDANEDKMANYDRLVQRQRQMDALNMQQRQLAVNMGKMEREYGLAQTNLPNRGMSGAEIG